MSGKQKNNKGAKTQSPIAGKPAKYFADPGKTIIADAPYNFISLPTDICPPHDMWKNPRRSIAAVMIEDEEGNVKEDVEATKHARDVICDIYEEYIQMHGKHSGHIELTIKTTRDTLVGMPRKEIDKKTGDEVEISTFFSIKNDEPMIPGSSLRGMTRNLFKIMTASSFRADEDFNERVLYYRDIASGDDSSELKGEYERNHSTEGDNNIWGGFLVRKRTISGNTEWEIYRDFTFSFEGTRGPDNYNVDNNINIRTEYPKVIWGETFEDGIKQIENQTKKGTSGALTCSTLVYCFNKKTYNKYKVTWPLKKESSKEEVNDLKVSYKVPEDVIQAYLDDERRGKNSVNLLYKKGKKDDNGVPGVALESSGLGELLGVDGVDLISPCLFVVNAETEEVKSFGHTKYYRIPYNYSIGDHVPSNLKNNYVDFTDLVFGLKEFWGGRVYFGDAELEKEDENGVLKDRNEIYRDTSIESVLLGANPTSYQMYLTQKDSSDRAHWNNEKAMIRGVKQYWHRFSIQPYKMGDNNKVLSKLKNIVKSGNTFKGKVYFKNLTTEELGALCKVLFAATGDSKEGISRDKSRRFKIGKGKSIGLGSIDIKSELFLESSDEYNKEEIWTENGILPLQAVSLSEGEQNIDTFIADFDKYVESTMTKETFTTLEDSLSDLYEMMVWKGINESFDTRTVHMSVQDKDDKRFVKRTALLEPKAFKAYKP